MDNSLQILSESLDAKINVLEDIQKYNLVQEKAFKEQKADIDSFDAAIEEKDALIERMIKLDDGFELLYERVAKQLEGNRELYKDQIRALQVKISKITELSVAIQAQEATNKKLVEEYFAKQKSAIAQNRRGSKAAYDYYKSMSGTGMNTSQFMDSKN